MRAKFCRDRETWRNRDAEIRHLGEVGTLSTEQIGHLCVAVGPTVSKKKDVLHSAIQTNVVSTTRASCRRS